MPVSSTGGQWAGREPAISMFIKPKAGSRLPCWGLLDPSPCPILSYKLLIQLLFQLEKKLLFLLYVITVIICVVFSIVLGPSKDSQSVWHLSCCDRTRAQQAPKRINTTSFEFGWYQDISTSLEVCCEVVAGSGLWCQILCMFLCGSKPTVSHTVYAESCSAADPSLHISNHCIKYSFLQQTLGDFFKRFHSCLKKFFCSLAFNTVIK